MYFTPNAGLGSGPRLTVAERPRPVANRYTLVGLTVLLPADTPVHPVFIVRFERGE
jgi:hypothetical protein